MENREKENGFKLVIKRKYVNKLGLRCTKLSSVIYHLLLKNKLLRVGWWLGGWTNA